MAAKNLDLAFEVIRRVVAEPDLASAVDRFAAEGCLVLYDEADDDLRAASDKLVSKARGRHEEVVPLVIERRLTLMRR
jgi:hypothetical protein